jgi:hypothetical protein
MCFVQRKFQIVFDKVMAGEQHHYQLVSPRYVIPFWICQLSIKVKYSLNFLFWCLGNHAGKLRSMLPFRTVQTHDRNPFHPGPFPGFCRISTMIFFVAE